MSDQTSIEPIAPTKLSELIDAARAVLHSGGLTDEQRQDLQTHVDTLEVQSRARTPNHVIVRESFRVISEIAKGVGFNLVSDAIEGAFL